MHKIDIVQGSDICNKYEADDYFVLMPLKIDYHLPKKPLSNVNK